MRIVALIQRIEHFLRVVSASYSSLSFLLSLHAQLSIKRVIDSLVEHFVRFEKEEKQLPVLWHQALLVFVQRYPKPSTAHMTVYFLYIFFFYFLYYYFSYQSIGNKLTFVISTHHHAAIKKTWRPTRSRSWSTWSSTSSTTPYLLKYTESWTSQEAEAKLPPTVRESSPHPDQLCSLTFVFC